MIESRITNDYDELFPVITRVIDMPKYYIIRKKEIIKQKIDEELAISLGFKADKYGSAKDHQNSENRLNMDINTGTHGSFGFCPKC